MFTALVVGCLAGAVTGAAGALLAASFQHGARLLRNRVLVARPVRLR